MDVELMKREFPHCTTEEIAKKLGRSVRAVSVMAYRLGLKKDHYGRVWTPQQLMMIRQLFPVTFNNALAKFLGVSKRALIRKARELGLEKVPGFVKDRQADISELIREGQRRSNKPMPSFPKGVHSNPANEFKPGHVESPETKAKRSEAMKRAWKRRKQREEFRRRFNINNS